jgi:hypothetical protein
LVPEVGLEPTWTQETLGPRPTDVVYDHPTPSDQEGTLGRLLQSLDVLDDVDFELVIIAVANAGDVEARVEEKVAGIIEGNPCPVPVHLFSHAGLRRVHEVLRKTGGGDFLDLLSLQGYSNIRNLCLFLPHLLGSDAAVFIDDDEVFRDPGFMRKAREYIGGMYEGNFVGAVAGYYLQPDGGWRITRERQAWMDHWDKVDRMNEAFEQIIGTEKPRLKETPFVFGGNMVVHRTVFTQVPFDPSVTRGEDIDFLINMRMFGWSFFLDNTLAILHLPPPKPHPIWKQIREDIYRFVRERAKLRTQEPLEGMIYVAPEMLDPYPGAFLKDDLEEKIRRTSAILEDLYRAQGKNDDAVQVLRNVEIPAEEARSGGNPFRRLLDIQGRWSEMMEVCAQEHIAGQLCDAAFR